MKKILYIMILSAVASVVSCKKHGISEVATEGKVLIVINAEKVTVEPQSVGTKAVSEDGFNESSVIGIFTKTENEPITDLVEVKDANFGYKKTNRSQYCDPINESDVIYFQPSKKISLYSYHPYSGTASNVTVNTSGDKIVTFSLNPNQNTQEDLYFNDLMFATCSGVFQEKPMANLAFSHKLCKITFNMFRGDNWINSPLLTGVAFKGVQIPLVATMRLVDGALTVAQPSDQLKTISWSSGSEIVGMSLNALTPVVVDLMTLPFAAEGCKFEFKASGKSYVATLPAIDFKSATNVVYNVWLNDNADAPIELDPQILDWEVSMTTIIEPY